MVGEKERDSMCMRGYQYLHVYEVYIQLYKCVYIYMYGIN